MFIQRSQPWTLAKDVGKAGELHGVLAALVRSITRQAVYLAPFMPAKAEELWAQLGGLEALGKRASAVLFSEMESLDTTGWRVRKGAALFPRPEQASQRDDSPGRAQHPKTRTDPF